MRNNRIVYAGMGIIAALAVLLAANSYLVNGYSGNQLTVQLTDPPHVPNGTKQLLVTYSEVQAQVKLANGSSEYISSSASGKVNLLSLVNASTIIGSMQIPQNSIVNKINFNITNAEIEINNTEYPVILPTNEISAVVHGRTAVNGSSSVMVDFTPTVVTLDTNNTQLYLLIPSVKAIFIGNIEVRGFIGGRSNLSKIDISSLNQIHSNVSIATRTITLTRDGMRLSININTSGNGAGNNQGESEGNVEGYLHGHVVSVENIEKDHLNIHINLIGNVQGGNSLNATGDTNSTTNSTSNTIATGNSSANGSINIITAILER